MLLGLFCTCYWKLYVHIVMYMRLGMDDYLHWCFAAEFIYRGGELASGLFFEVVES